MNTKQNKREEVKNLFELSFWVTGAAAAFGIVCLITHQVERQACVILIIAGFTAAIISISIYWWADGGNLLTIIKKIGVGIFRGIWKFILLVSLTYGILCLYRSVPMTLDGWRSPLVLAAGLAIMICGTAIIAITISLAKTWDK